MPLLSELCSLLDIKYPPPPPNTHTFPFLLSNQHTSGNAQYLYTALFFSYEDTLSGLQSAVQCSSCRSPLALTCIRCNPTNGRTLVPPRHITVLPHPRQADVSDRVDDEGDRVDDKSDMMDDEGDRMDGKGDSVDGNGDRVDGEGERVDDVDDRVEEPVMKDDQKKRKDFRVRCFCPPE